MVRSEALATLHCDRITIHVFWMKFQQIETLEKENQELEFIVDMYGKECSESRYDLIVIVITYQLCCFLMIVTYAILLNDHVVLHQILESLC